MRKQQSRLAVELHTFLFSTMVSRQFLMILLWCTRWSIQREIFQKAVNEECNERTRNYLLSEVVNHFLKALKSKNQNVFATT